MQKGCQDISWTVWLELIPEHEIPLIFSIKLKNTAIALSTVKLGDKERFDKEQIGVKERFDKEQIGVKEPFTVTNCQFTS